MIILLMVFAHIADLKISLQLLSTYIHDRKRSETFNLPFHLGRYSTE